MQSNNPHLKPKTWVEISKDNLIHNLRIFQKIVRKRVKIMTVVKANAYGHCLEKIVPILDKEGVEWFGVDSLNEALQVRNLGVTKPILVLGYMCLENVKQAIENDISFVVYDFEICKRIAQLKLTKKAKVHIKIETGLNRQGLSGKEFTKLASFIFLNNQAMVLEGVSTHFADIEDTLDPSFAMKQHKIFNEIVKKVKRNNKNIIAHCAASASTLLYKKTHHDMVRLGISLYGLWPSKETKIAMSLKGKNDIKLKPVLSWKSIVAQVKTIKTGESVGYGRMWYAPRESKIGIIPVGYFDGYDRKLSNNSYVLVNDQFASVVGRVAMNMVVVNLTDIKNVNVGDEVTLVGKDNHNKIVVDDLAQRLGTINYEVVSRINPNLPRIIV